MKVLYLCLIALTCCISFVSALERGMTTKEVRKELGKPESKLLLGSKEVHIYPNGDKLVFINGGLSTMNGNTFGDSTIDDIQTPAKTVEITETVKSTHSDTLLGRAPKAQEDKNVTITKSAQEDGTGMTPTGEEYDYSDMMDNFEGSLNDYEAARHKAAYGEAPPSSAEKTIELIVGFFLEVIITLIVLKIAFSVVGFPALWRQLLLLSMAVSLSSVMVAFVFDAGIMNPVRNGLSFILLLILIPKMTDVREWSTAISIAITARLVSIVLMWLIFGAIIMMLGKFI